MAETLLLPVAPAPLTPQHRRLRAEWSLLQQLVQLNPTRLAQPQAADTTFSLTLLSTPALPLQTDSAPLSTHPLRIVYPPFFPAVPLELYLQTPVLHPNIHPETGFVCLWDTHRTSNTIEHALLKTAAMLGWHLLNLESRHIMQPQPALLSPAAQQELRARLGAPALVAVTHSAATLPQPTRTPRRHRLS